MADTFEKKYSLQHYLYAEGSPIVILTGELLKNLQTNKIVAQLRMQNISGRTIKAVKITFATFDIFGKRLPEVEEYQYLDLLVENGSFFGSKNIIAITNINCRVIEIDRIAVMFADNDVWESNGKRYLPMQVPQKLQAEMDSELIKQYQLATTPKAICVPREQEDYWICTCGTVNKDALCSACHCTKSIIFSSYDLTELTQKMRKRLEKEQKEQAEAERSRQVRKTRIIKTSILSLTAIVTFVFVWIFLIFPAIRYHNAGTMMEAGRYVEAEDIFLELNGYKDSAEKIKECRYASATTEQACERYEIAYEMFISLGEYADSEAMAKVCAQAAGDVALSKQKFSEAIEWYELAKNEEAVNEAKYIYVLTCKNNKQLDMTAYDYLGSLANANYKNSKELYSELYTWNIDVIAFNTSPDSMKKLNFVTKNSPIYIHFQITGGPPNEFFRPYLEYTFPNGQTGSYVWPTDCSFGEVLYFGWENWIHSSHGNSASGNLIVNFYTDADSEEPIETILIVIID